MSVKWMHYHDQCQSAMIVRFWIERVLFCVFFSLHVISLVAPDRCFVWRTIRMDLIRNVWVRKCDFDDQPRSNSESTMKKKHVNDLKIYCIWHEDWMEWTTITFFALSIHRKSLSMLCFLHKHELVSGEKKNRKKPTKANKTLTAKYWKQETLTTIRLIHGPRDAISIWVSLQAVIFDFGFAQNSIDYQRSSTRIVTVARWRAHDHHRQWKLNRIETSFRSIILIPFWFCFFLAFCLFLCRSFGLVAPSMKLVVSVAFPFNFAAKSSSCEISSSARLYYYFYFYFQYYNIIVIYFYVYCICHTVTCIYNVSHTRQMLLLLKQQW